MLVSKQCTEGGGAMVFYLETLFCTFLSSLTSGPQPVPRSPSLTASPRRILAGSWPASGREEIFWTSISGIFSGEGLEGCGGM